MRVREMGNGRVVIKSDGTLRLCFGGNPVPIKPDQTERERSMRLGQRIIKLDGVLGGRFRLRQGISRGHVRDNRERSIGFSETKISQRVTGILVDSLLKEAKARFYLRRRQFVPVIPTG